MPVLLEALFYDTAHEREELPCLNNPQACMLLLLQLLPLPACAASRVVPNVAVRMI
jgi:hypothetical protein